MSKVTELVLWRSRQGQRKFTMVTCCPWSIAGSGIESIGFNFVWLPSHTMYLYQTLPTSFLILSTYIHRTNYLCPDSREGKREVEKECIWRELTRWRNVCLDEWSETSKSSLVKGCKSEQVSWPHALLYTLLPLEEEDYVTSVINNIPLSLVFFILPFPKGK